LFRLLQSASRFTCNHVAQLSRKYNKVTIMTTECADGPTLQSS